MTRSRLKDYFLLLVSFHFTLLHVGQVDSFSSQRQRYASRMLKITPKECTAPDYPNITGICMISLECQQRSGTVIGACRDGHLFGACCHDPLATSSQVPETSPTSTTTSTTTEVPSSERSIENNEISAPSRDFDDSSSSSNSDSTQIPSLIDTFSELSPTFLSELALDEHTTGIYGNRDEIMLSDDADRSSSSTPAVVIESFKTPRSTILPAEVSIPPQSSERPADNFSSAPEEDEVVNVGTFGHDPVFKDSMIKYIDEIVTMRNNDIPIEDDIPPLENNEMSIDDIPFSTFTIVSSTKPSEDPIVYSWSSTTSGTSNVDVTTTPAPAIPTTTTEATPFSSTIKNKNASEEVISVSIAHTVGPLISAPGFTEGVSSDVSMTTDQSTEATGPTKFTFSKLKYTPRPFKPRQTTRRMIWTRPTTTTPEPFWIKPVDITGDDADEDEEDENDEENQVISSTTYKSTSSSALPSSTEQSTVPFTTTSTEGTSSSAPVDDDDIMDDLPYSSEAPLGMDHSPEFDTDQEATTPDFGYSPSGPSQTTGYGYDWSTPSIMSYLKGTSESLERLYYGIDNNGSRSASDYGTTAYENEVNTSPTGPSAPASMTTSWRTSTPEIEANTLKSTAPSGPSSPASSSWDTSIDSFVDQVVDGIVQDLNKSNKIDDMIFNSEANKKKEASSTNNSGGTGERRSDSNNVFSTTPAAVKYTSLKNKMKTSGEKIKVKNTSARPTAASTTSASSESPVVSTTSKERLKKVKVKVPAGTHKRRQNKEKTKPIKKVTTIKTANSTRKRLDYKKDCGVRPLIKRGRIVGGTPSQFGSWPWHTLVKETVWWGIFSKIKCGGVLIGAQHVLTAAHCQPQQTGTLSVVLGITDSDDTDSRAITKTVRRVIPHPQFNPRTYENDIAILELESPVDFQPHIVPICLPRDDDELEGKTAFVTGMGLLKHDGERPLVLQEVDLPILNNTECQKMFVRSGNMKPIIESFICAGYEQGRKDSCGGDSGGPLSVKRPNGQWVLAGTVSHGIKCALPDQPGVYMRTSYYKPWIDRVLNVARTRYRGIPRCNAPPLICARQRYQQQNQPRNENGFVNTLFRIFRLARKMVEEGRKSG